MTKKIRAALKSDYNESYGVLTVDGELPDERGNVNIDRSAEIESGETVINSEADVEIKLKTKGGSVISIDIPVASDSQTGVIASTMHKKLSELPSATELEKELAGKQPVGNYITEEKDPTVPAWAKAPQKPSYTFAEVGADPEGTATSTVNAHNTSQYSHQDIRLLIEGLDKRLNALADSDDVTLDQMSELVAYIKDNRELIEGVTTNKVNVSDIINNLSTNVSNKPLSAAQGVALKNLIQDIKVPDDLSDLNDDSTHRLVTDSEKARWNSKSDFSGSYADLFDKPFGETWLSTGNDTLTSDDIVYGGYHKVSNATPSLTDVQKGCEISYYRVSGGSITGDPIIITDSTAEFKVNSNENGILINYDGDALIVISYTGIGTFGAVNFPDITSPGVYFRQGSYGCTHSFKLTGYNGFPLKVTKKMDEEWLPDSVVKTVNHRAPDANGNVNVEVSSGSGTPGIAFDTVSNDALIWDGDNSNKVVVCDRAYDENFTYVKVSDVVPELSDFQNGFKVVWNYGESYECTSEDAQEGAGYIRLDNNSIFIIKEDGATFNEEDITFTFPEKGLYLLRYTEGEKVEYVSQLIVNGYEGFTKPVLKTECMPVQYKDWYGKVVTAGNTAVSDGIIHGGYVKVSDVVPTEEEIRNGGMIRHYNVENNQSLGDLIVGDYLGADYGISVREEAIAITYGLELLVIVSINGSPNVGAFIIDAIDSPGVYFVQNGYSVVHSLTINEFTGFNNNIEKVPIELLPKDYIEQLIKEVVGSMNILITKEA